MIFLDSWVWCEYVFEGDSFDAANQTIDRAADEGGLVASTVLAEVSYVVRRESDRETANRAVEAIRGFDEIDSVPVTDDVALRGAELRDKYYERGEREMSYADTIHLAVASMIDCDALYTGDPDFRGVEEVDTVVL